MQVFNIDLADEGVQATPSTQTTSTQTTISLEHSLANILRGDDDDESLRRKIDALADGLGSQRNLIDELLKVKRAPACSQRPKAARLYRASSR